MARIRKRRYRREPLAKAKATHLLKIGCYYPVPQRGGGTRMQPVKLPGFVVFHNRLDADHRLMVDVDAMQLLMPTIKGDPWTPYFASPKGQPFPPCPNTLNFYLPSNAKEGDTGWCYDFFEDQYQCWGKGEDGAPIRCMGDGVKATRTSGGRMQTLECVPVGREGATDKEFCPYSVPNAKGVSQCACVCSLTVCAYAVDPDGAQIRLGSLGAAARYLYSTHSEQASMAIGDVLDSASQRVGGFITGIRGVMMLGNAPSRMLHPNAPVPVAYVGRVKLALSDEDLQARENELRPMLTGIPPVGLIEDHSLAIEAPEGTVRDAAQLEMIPDPDSDGAAPEPPSSDVSADAENAMPFSPQEESAPDGPAIDDAAPEALLDKLASYAWKHSEADVTAYTTTTRDDGRTVSPNKDAILAALKSKQQRPQMTTWLRGICHKVAEQDQVGWNQTWAPGA